jgi:cytochrome c2
LEPNVFAAALQLQADPGYDKLTEQEQDWLQQLVDHPDRNEVRYRVLEMLELDARQEQPRLSPVSLNKLTPLFRDIESPGTQRKVGPSLRFVAAKNDAAFLVDWIREPKHFRPSTRMPQFFGLNKHLEGSPGLEDARKFEPIEILGLVTYLQSMSQKFEYIEPSAGVTGKPDAARGKTAMQTRGCLACHNHKAFPDTQSYRNPDEIVQGPDLSGVGDKFVGEKGRKWLYSWIRQPSRYHARTVMPDLFLDVISTKSPQGAEQVTDPAADIVEFLLSDSSVGWKPVQESLTEVNPEQLDQFVQLNLADTFALHRASLYSKQGIPESMRDELKGSEVELLVPDSQHADRSFELTREQKLRYIGSKTIVKYGCYACHDIAGFEDAKPIGTVLADWGRKDSARLAFEHITHYLEHGNGHGAAPAGAPGAAADEQAADHGGESQADLEYFQALVKSGHRAGFLYQKLKEPRSYDFHKTENKKYSERLRMPQFPFDAHDREAVMTFVLGLVADPPNDKYIYKPTERTKALLAGREVLEKYNCGGCHILSPEKWDLVFESGKFGEQAAVKIYPYLKTHFSPQTLEESAKPDRSGLLRASVHGMPTVDDTGVPIAYDDVGELLDPGSSYETGKLELPLDLWRPAALQGKPFEVGVLPLNVPTPLVEKRHGSDGGFLTKYLLPHVVALEKQANPAAKGAEAWGWLPPPLIGEGKKVQTDWLHSFLLNPYPIRPATFLRMPRFNMSPAEATHLVNYFAAIDSAEYPYAFSSRRQPEHLARAESAYQRALQGAQFDGKPRTRLDDAMRVVVNNNYCVKCHLVGDFVPAGSDRAKAPNLAQVYRRLRPEFVRNWIANPKSYLPYTSMPVNIPYDPDLPNLGGVAQELFHGTSADQVDGLVDLLMNFDEYAKQRNSVANLVKDHGGPVAPTPPPAAGGANE